MPEEKQPTADLVRITILAPRVLRDAYSFHAKRRGQTLSSALRVHMRDTIENGTKGVA